MKEADKTLVYMQYQCSAGATEAAAIAELPTCDHFSPSEFIAPFFSTNDQSLGPIPTFNSCIAALYHVSAPYRYPFLYDDILKLTT